MADNDIISSLNGMQQRNVKRVCRMASIMRGDWVQFIASGYRFAAKCYLDPKIEKYRILWNTQFEDAPSYYERITSWVSGSREPGDAFPKHLKTEPRFYLKGKNS
jgi:hypothetical protein